MSPYVVTALWALVAGAVDIDFEGRVPGSAVAGWEVPPASPGYVAIASDEQPASGERCLELRALPSASSSGWGTVQHHVDAADFRGRPIAVSARIRTLGSSGAGRAQMFVKVERPGGAIGFVDNMHDRPVTVATWVPCTITGTVDGDATRITVGLMIKGAGRAWIDDIHIRATGDVGRGNDGPRPLDDAALARVSACIRLLGYVQYFHPSDESMEVDWGRFAVDALGAAERAGTPAELATALMRVFGPIAPTLQVWAGSPSMAPPAEVERGAAVEVVGLRHRGLGADRAGTPAGGVYVSVRVTEAVDAPVDARRIAPPGAATVVELGAGVSCRVPLTLYVLNGVTRPPAVEPLRLNAARAPGWAPGIADRGTRLAIVGSAWNLFQHFYPYFDLIDCDWPQVLATALRDAAVAPTEEGFLEVMRRLVAAAHDGHGRVWHGGAPTHHAPLACGWAGDQLVVLRSTVEVGVAPGAVVLALDGEPIADVVARIGAQVSASTPGWTRHIVAQRVGSGIGIGPVRYVLRGPDGTGQLVTARRISGPQRSQLFERRPAPGTEVAPGIHYFDLDSADQAAWQAALPQLVAARGVVLDMRGYPGTAGTLFLQHLTDRTVHSAWWQIPVYIYPDQRDVDFETSRWTLTPLEPRLPGPVAVLTDGRAISYAESVMGIVEHYRLAEIVGSPTAGTNGNVNQRELPGGVTLVWTGMRVDKHDGTPLHGVGIMPTVPCQPTVEGIAAGRDEVLDQGIEVIRARLMNP